MQITVYHTLMMYVIINSIDERPYHLYKIQLMPISDSQVFIALFIALFTGILAVRLGLELYS